MTILEEIIANKRREVATLRDEVPVKRLEKSIYFSGPCLSMSKYIKRPDLSGVIAEIKRRSPSRGVINQYISVKELSIGYMQAGASALSVLTDTRYFGGASEDLTTVRKANLCPILRKDFLIDEYQVIEAKSIGADAILLIAAALTTEEIRKFSELAKSLGLEVVVEVHSLEELKESPLEAVDIVGVNNRDLSTFAVDITLSEKLINTIPKDKVRISESGISDVSVAKRLRAAGYDGFLIGEHFMAATKPAEACSSFVSAIRS